MNCHIVPEPAMPTTTELVRIALEPWRRTQIDASLARRIERHADNLAGEALDRGDECARGWMSDEGIPQDVISVLLALYAAQVAPKDTDRAAALERAASALRDRYIQATAMLFKGEAEAEIVEAAMDSAEDR